MAYAKFDLQGVYSANADYSNPNADTTDRDLTATPDKVKYGIVDVPTAAALTIFDVSVEDWSSCDFLYIYNQDGTNYVTVTYDDSGSNARTLIVAAGKTLLIEGGCDLTSATGADVTLQADTAAVNVEFMIIGSE